mmetsp:Transcript_75648/g.133512  ORF Transcript_75648/g.133512 Transcript_75648/m.133512 type:complete len:575 (+) Transcript_75648:70-1794(+)|eukprot:CAMPEP_0197656670 /NCGR_PEP_ID=MMETSP1338-20131121/42829_1 /TAXON_ID=43686 ORGANISM="Pelagodinium beii, Strain RCC1491" /NCGR_SAMPLE_ID=MMETSP1338 /ASSEMBLY_ACC=CAM_ASM_000754 /LENGTH=574 /DNA_ID=CAMNT_0043232775 /DNA_START=70 /DNA_END=1794 /DNA_ORIENTATION=+
MGFLRKLSFWKKSSSTAVEPFLQPGEAQLPKQKSPTASLKYLPSSTTPTGSELATASQATDAPADVQASSPKEAATPSRRSPAQSVNSRISPSLRAAAASPESACFADLTDGSAKASVPLAAAPVEDNTAAVTNPKEETVPVPDGPSPIDFTAPLSEIYAGVGEEFGQMVATSLQSTKWDKRSHALKSIAATLKGLDLDVMAAPGSTGVLGRGLRLRDRTRCWRLSCQLLNHIMRDKVIPVRLAALDLFIDTFANTEGAAEKTEVQYAAGILIEHLLDRLGDSNLRLHETARKCVLFTSERPGMLGLGGVLSRLRARLQVAPKGGERTKVIYGVLDAVSVLLEHFPGRRSLDQAIDLDDDLDEPLQIQTAADSWTIDNITGFVIAGMEDSLGTRVRNTAVAIAGTVYKNFGNQAVEPLLKGLRPAKQALLKEKFKDLEEDCNEEDVDDGEEGEARPDLDDFMICGSALKPSPAAMPSLQLPGSMGAEEDFMDGILEETGMVFNGGSLNVGGVQQFLGTADFEDMSIEDQFLLEQELIGLGLELDELDEQQALMNEIFNDLKQESTMANCPVNVF